MVLEYSRILEYLASIHSFRPALMPYGGFEWVDPTEYVLENVKDKSDKGHILEVSSEYHLASLHEIHND